MKGKSPLQRGASQKESEGRMGSVKLKSRLGNGGGTDEVK